MEEVKYLVRFTSSYDIIPGVKYTRSIAAIAKNPDDAIRVAIENCKRFSEKFPSLPGGALDMSIFTERDVIGVVRYDEWVPKE